MLCVDRANWCAGMGEFFFVVCRWVIFLHVLDVLQGGLHVLLEHPVPLLLSPEVIYRGKKDAHTHNGLAQKRGNGTKLSTQTFKETLEGQKRLG